MSNYIYGIDFGTSNSALAILDTTTNEIVKLFTIPSLLFFTENKGRAVTNEVFVGKKAIEAYISNRLSGRFMKSIKKVLPNKSFIDTRIGTKMYRAEDLVALIITALKSLADDYLNTKVNTAVIGRPVVFDTDPERDALAESRLNKAAKISGFENISFQYEPIGAAYTYEKQIKTEKLVLVADFGGGTSDFSLIKLRPSNKAVKNRKKDMLDQGGIYIGGDNFDSDIMWHRGTPHFGRGVKEEFTPGKPLDLPLSYFQNICSWEKMNFLDTLRMKLSIDKSYTNSKRDYRVKNLQILIAENLGYGLFKQIEKAKIALTEQSETDFDFNERGIIFTENISLESFKDNIINENLLKITNYLEEFLSKNNVIPSQIDEVFMTGGTSMIKPLKDVFIEKFGEAKIQSGDNFNSVAIGLAYSWSYLSNEN